MKLVYLAIPIFFLSLSSSYAQHASLTIGLGKPLKTHTAYDASGSPYLSETFQNSEVVTPGGQTLKGVPIRYNIYDQTVECMINGQVSDVTDSVASFTYTDSLLRVKTFFKPAAAISKNGKSFYYELLVKGEFSLLKRYRTEITSDEDWYTKKVTKTFTLQSEYYLLAHNKITDLGTSKKSLFAAFDNNPSVKEKFDKQHPDLKNESSLIVFFKELD